MTTRRYDDDEVRQIFSLATTGAPSAQSLPVETGGFTLDELKEIGREAGIEPALVGQAAAALDARQQPALVRRAFGMPMGVSRVVELPRAPTDREWEVLVARFRSTFGVQGTVSNTGGLRDWSKGNLHICIEPTEHGSQLRLSTFKEDAVALNGLGFVMGGMSVLMGSVAALGGKPEKALVLVAMFGGLSLASFAANLIRLPRWARTRDRQMEEIAAHAVQLLAAGEPGDASR